MASGSASVGAGWGGGGLRGVGFDDHGGGGSSSSLLLSSLELSDTQVHEP